MVILLLLGLPNPWVIRENVERFEYNVTIHELEVVQLIMWSGYPTGQHVCCLWMVHLPAVYIRRRAVVTYYKKDGTVVRVYAPFVHETETDYDPEVEDKMFLPSEDRRWTPGR